MPRLAALCLVLATAATPAAAQLATGLEPAQIGAIYCLAMVGGDMAPVSGLLTPALATAIAAAEAENAAYEAAHPGDKPPLGDGLPWQAGADYTPRCAVGSVTAAGDLASVHLDYAFPDYPAGNFSDVLELRLVADTHGRQVWRIDNVRFATGDMRAALLAAFAD